MGRITNDELNESISPINVEKFKTEYEGQINSDVYAEYNSQGLIAESGAEEVFAVRSATSNGATEYKVSINRRNVPRDPYNKHQLAESTRLGKQTGQPPYLLVKTDQVGFDAYIQYLRTRDVAQLRLAERRIK